MIALTQDPLASAQRMVESFKAPYIHTPSAAALPVISALGGNVALLSAMTRKEIRGALTGTLHVTAIHD